MDRKVRINTQSELVIPTRLILNEFFSSWNNKYYSLLKNIINDKPNFSLKEYVFRIYYYNQLVNQKYNSSSIDSEVSCSRNKKNLDVFFALMIICVLLILFVDNFIPANKQNMDLFGFNVGSHGFNDVKTFSWYISQKFAMSILAFIWLINNVSWWRWAILSPIIFYSYQFWESFQPVEDIDGSGNLNVFPLVFLTILGVFLLSKVIRRISINLDYQVFLEEELEKSIGELSRLERGV